MQLSESQSELVKRQLLQMQLIAGALLSGVIFFAGFVLVFTAGDTWSLELDVISIIAVLVGFGNLVAAVLVVKIVLERQAEAIKHEPTETSLESAKRTQWSDVQIQALVEKYQTFLIIRLGLLEGAIFFNLVAFLVEQNYATLLMGGFLFLMMACLFPTRSKIESFLELRSFI